jgi:hypothetical protein
MSSIRVAPTSTDLILYPSLCPTGYDPVLARDNRVASALSRRHLPICVLPSSLWERSIDCRTLEVAMELSRQEARDAT